MLIGVVKIWQRIPAAWRLSLAYTAIIVVVSAVFSLAIYDVSVRQLDQSFRSHYMRFQTLGGGLVVQQPFDIESEIDLAHQRLKLQLVYLNGLIIVAGAGASYWLARRTLRPIEESLAAQSRFTADASHELRTPLSAMQTEIEVALRGDLSAAEAKELLKSNLEEVAKLRQLSDGLLRLARAKEQSPALEQINLADVTSKAMQSLEIIAARRGVTIEAKLPSAGLTVIGDAVSLGELVVILLDNAIKYGGEDHVVEVDMRRRGRFVYLSVADAGPGIAASDLPHIFDRFYRADASRHHVGTDAGGYGLGLAIARSVAETHLGELSAANRPTGGAVFTLRLPVADA